MCGKYCEVGFEVVLGCVEWIVVVGFEMGG